jgi:hypothetical protein
LSGGSLINYLASSGDYHNTLAVDPIDPETVYGGGICLVASYNGGLNWEAVAQGDTDGPHRDHHALAFDAAGRLLNGNDGGIWRLDDPLLTQWTNLNGNLGVTQMIGLGLHPTDPNSAYGGTQDTGGVKYQGTTRWPRLQRGDGGATAVSLADPNRIYQITRRSSSSPNLFRRAENGGQVCRDPNPAADCDVWQIRVTGIDPNDTQNFYPPFVLDPAFASVPSADRLMLGTTRVYETTNGADNWTPISSPNVGGWTTTANIDAVQVAPSDVNTVYATAGGHIFVTFNRGTTWQQRDLLGLSDHVRALAVQPTDRMTAYAVRDRFGGGHVFHTLNGGQTWIDISGNLPDLPTNSIALDSRTTPTTLYVGTDDGVYVSTNLGVQWARYGAGLPNAQVADLKLNTNLNILAAATHGRGVWEILTGPAPLVAPRPARIPGRP